MSTEPEDEKPLRGPIFPGIVMTIAGVFLAITAVIQANEYDGKVTLKIVAGLLLAAYGVFRILRR